MVSMSIQVHISFLQIESVISWLKWQTWQQKDYDWFLLPSCLYLIKIKVKTLLCGPLRINFIMLTLLESPEMSRFNQEKNCLEGHIKLLLREVTTF